MEVLKDFESLFEVDERWKLFGQGDPTYLKQLYTGIQNIELIPGVPEDVASQFNVAKMLTIYAWNYYPLNQVAKLKAFSVLEMALREKFAKKKYGLYKLLELAVKSNLIQDQIFEPIFHDREIRTGYSLQLPEVISSLRNDLAHGSITLTNESGLFTLRHCAVIINSLFKAHENVRLD